MNVANDDLKIQWQRHFTDHYCFVIFCWVNSFNINIIEDFKKIVGSIELTATKRKKCELQASQSKFHKLGSRKVSAIKSYYVKSTRVNDLASTVEDCLFCKSLETSSRTRFANYMQFQ